MSDESKPYPASELKLERLREQGVVPYSPEVDTAAVLLGLTFLLLFFFTLLGGHFVEFAERAFGFSLVVSPEAVSGDQQGIPSLVYSAGSLTFFSITFVLLPIIFLLVLVGLLQTRFLFTPSSIGLRFSRLFDVSALSLAAFVRRFFGALVRSALLLSSLFLSWMLLQYFFSEVPVSEYGSASHHATSGFLPVTFSKLPFLSFARSMAYFALGTLVAVSMLFACGGYFIRVFRFRALHRMSRSELEAEYREMGPSPELLSARKDQLREPD